MRKLIWLLRLRFSRVAVCLAVVAMMLACRPASAQIIMSNASLGDLQNALVSGATNVVLAFSDTIVTTSPLEVVADITLDGTGASPVISGNNVSQIFHVDPGVHFTLINVTLSGANNIGATGTVGTAGGNGGSTGGNGGNGLNGTNSLGGAVYNEGNCSFITCLFLTNTATGGAGGAGGNGGNGNNTGGRGGNGGNGGVGYGGAIYNLGTVFMSNCTVAGNFSIGGAGGVGGTNGSGTFASYPGAGGAGGASGGGGVYNLGHLTIVNSTLNQNGNLGGTSQTGGGPTGSGQNGGNGANGGSVTGGAICNLGTNSILNCTFFANTATGGIGGTGGNGNTNGLSTGGSGGNGGNATGGGIYNAPGALIAVTNCTFSGDVVTGGTNGVAGAGNFAGHDGSIGSVGGANIYNGNTGATFLLKNTILDFPTNTTSASGTITDQGNNLSSDATPTFTTTNSFNNKDPKLSVTGLAGNGSSTVFTIGLSANSPAVNAIYDGSAPPYDERNFPRPGQIRPCIGAYEFGVNFTNYNVFGEVTVGGRPLAGIVVSAGQLSVVTGTNGTFSFSLSPSNTTVIRANPSAYFSPGFANVVPTNFTGPLIFNATNAGIVFTNINGGKTNTVFTPFIGLPNFASYHLQATTNLSTNGTVWTDIASFNPSTNAINVTPFGWFTGNTNNNTNFFRAITP